MTVVGVVVEGTNDYPVFQAFLDQHLPDSFSRPVVLKEIQPLQDATSGNYSGGGWHRVVGWCVANKASAIETFFTPIEEADSPCDLILIQIDGDAMEQCGTHAATPCPAMPCAIDERLSALEGFVLEWLEPTADRAAQILFAFPTMSSEAWLMAGLKPHERNWEHEPDPKSHFRNLKRSEAKTTKIKEYYSTKSKEAFANSAQISAQCRSFVHALAQIRTPDP